MKKRILLQGLFITLLGLFMTNSYGQLSNVYGLSVKGTANAVWDSANKRYLYSYQDITKTGTLYTYNEASIYQCDSIGSPGSVVLFTNLGNQLKAPTGLLIKGNYLYVADWTKIWVVNLSDGTVADQILAPLYPGFQDIATDGVNTLYVSNFIDSCIYAYNMTDKTYSILPDTNNKISWPTGIYYVSTPKPKLYISSFVSNAPISCYDFTAETFATVYPTTYKFCYSIIADTKGNYFLSDWFKTTPKAGTVYKFIGGFSASLPFVEQLNFPADLYYQPIGDILVVPELNSGVKTLKFVKADRDLIPPKVDSFQTLSATKIVIYFSEPVTSASATDPDNYSGLNPYTSITLDPITKNKVTVILTNPLVPNIKKDFYVQNIKDIAWNIMPTAAHLEVTWRVKSIYDEYLKSGLTVGPIPARNRFNISYELLQPAHVNIELYDMIGKLVANFYNGNQKPDNYEINCQLPNSINNNSVYILKVNVGGQIFMSKILVDR
jgi:hypothetical protein